MNQNLNERGAHKAGCECGFCKNKGSFGKKKDADKDKSDGDEKESTAESIVRRVLEKNWIKGAVNPEHKGYCTPMSKDTCTPRRKALARRFKSGDLHGESRAACIVTKLLDEGT